MQGFLKPIDLVREEAEMLANCAVEKFPKLSAYVKAAIQVLMVTLFLVMGLSGCSIEKTETSESQSAKCESTDTKFCIWLPPLADVQLSSGQSKTGRIVKINTKKRQINVELGGDSESVPIDSIEKIVFKNEESQPESTRLPPIRGTEIWSVMPASAFHFDVKRSLAEVKQEAVTREQQVGGFMNSLAKRYEVQEIWFSENSSDTLKLKVKAE